jgi:hypothetical protein
MSPGDQRIVLKIEDLTIAYRQAGSWNDAVRYF